MIEPEDFRKQSIRRRILLAMEKQVDDALTRGVLVVDLDEPGRLVTDVHVVAERYRQHGWVVHQTGYKLRFEEP